MTASADPDRLLDLHDHLRRAANLADDACDRATTLRRTAGATGTLGQPGWRIDLHEGVEVRAGAAVQQVQALARAVAQVAEAFALADRGSLDVPGPSAGSQRSVAPTALAEALANTAPGLPPVVSGDLLRAASVAGSRAGERTRAALDDLDGEAPGASAHLLATEIRELHRAADGDEVLLRAATATFLASIDAEDLGRLVGALCDHELRRGPDRPLGLLARALTAVASGPTRNADLERLVLGLGTGTAGRNALRVAISSGFAPPPRLAARIARTLLLRSDASSDLGQGGQVAPGTDPTSRWLDARHADGDEPALDLLAGDAAAAERFLGSDLDAVAERVERLVSVGDRRGGQRSLATLVGVLSVSASTVDADGTTSARGRAIVRGLVAGTTHPTAIDEPLAEALATTIALHPDAYEALAASVPDDRDQLDRHLRAITPHRWPTVVLAAGLMDHRRRTMAASLHAPFERRVHALEPSRSLQGAIERAGTATDQVEVDTTVFTVARSLVPLLSRQATVALGGGPVVGGAVLVAQLAATSWLDDERDRYRQRARPSPSMPLLTAARSQLRLDAWRAIAADPSLAGRLTHRGAEGDPTAPDAPLQLDPDALAEWEQSQPAELQDLVATFGRPFEAVAGTAGSPGGD